jgi:hypothetical protein
LEKRPRHQGHLIGDGLVEAVIVTEDAGGPQLGGVDEAFKTSLFFTVPTFTAVHETA